MDSLVPAFLNALSYARCKSVLVEAFMEGEEFCVDGLMYRGKYTLGGISGKERSRPPDRFDLGIYMPPSLDNATVAGIVEMTRRALTAVGMHTGTAHVEVIVGEEGPRIVEMAGRLGGGRIPTDLIPLTYGMDFMADSLRLAFDEPPRERRTIERGTALFWLPARPGVATDIRNVAEARALPGVVDLVVSIKPGERVEPIVDCVTRDRIGYVLTCCDTIDEAVAAARQVLQLCEVVTRPA
jgi:hypothetical protein